MNDKKLISPTIFALLLSATIIFALYQIVLYLLNTSTIVVFCDVGEGDAAYIRIHNRIDILIDAGPDKKVLECLGSHMPFFDHTIEYAFMTHPQKDHVGGYTFVLDKYYVNEIYIPAVDNTAQFFQNLKKKIQTSGATQMIASSDIHIAIFDDKVDLLWPPSTHIQSDNVHLNDYSTVILLKEGHNTILFTGDATPNTLSQLPQSELSHLTILKIPHHGSKNGLTPEFFNLADPGESVISVGKHNRYGHPSKDILDILTASKTVIRRTDIEGNIVFTL